MYDMSVVYQLMPSLSINDNNQTYVFHNSIIVPASDVEAVVVHFFRQKVLYTPPPRNWCGFCQSRGNILLER